MPGTRCTSCYDDTFDEESARTALRRLRREGPRRSTTALADALAARGVEGLTVLDIGAGIGVVHLLLLERGASVATDVDASRPYLEAAREEARRRGLEERVTFIHGDVVGLAAEVPPADLVALDRVVCCYGDVDALVTTAARRTNRRLGIVLPPDGGLARLVVGLANAWQRLTRSSFRLYAHPHGRVVAAARAEGLEPRGTTAIGLWRLLVFERPILIADSR
jgi:SAM-dependent methyltransferase